MQKVSDKAKRLLPAGDSTGIFSLLSCSGPQGLSLSARSIAFCTSCKAACISAADV
jgi:hypothetical protein